MRHQKVSELGFTRAGFSKKDSNLIFATFDKTVVDSSRKISKNEFLINVDRFVCVQCNEGASRDGDVGHTLKKAGSNMGSNIMISERRDGEKGDVAGERLCLHPHSGLVSVGGCR